MVSGDNLNEGVDDGLGDGEWCRVMVSMIVRMMVLAMVDGIG